MDLMIIKNKELDGGDSLMIKIDGVVRIVPPQQNIKVKNGYKFNTKKFDKVIRLAKPETS